MHVLNVFFHFQLIFQRESKGVSLYCFIPKVDEYLAHMTSSIGERENYISQLMSETAGFAGCEIIRRCAVSFV